MDKEKTNISNKNPEEIAKKNEQSNMLDENKPKIINDDILKINKIGSARISLNEIKTNVDIRKSTPFPANTLKIKENEIKSSLSIESLKKIKLDQFDEDIFVYPREYNEHTKKYGKKFFQYRYLKKNTKEKDKEDLRRNIYFLLIIIEKSIFYFNQKKFKESIELLLDEKIIKDIQEFGEFIFVIDGFDKNVISSFFSNENQSDGINTNQILVNFLNCINTEFEGTSTSFLDTLKYFLSCLNNPTKEIIQKFTIKYFKTNKDNKEFIKTYQTFDIFSLLISNILLVNNILIGKTKEKSNIIKIDNFCKANKKLDKKICQNIFKEIKLHPISSNDNYLQKFYKKLSYLVVEYNENSQLDNANFDSFFENILNDNPKRDYNNSNKWFSYRKSLSLYFEDNKSEEEKEKDNENKKEKENEKDKNKEIDKIKEFLSKPIKFTKFVTNSTTSHLRAFAFKDNLSTLIWAKSIEEGKIKGNLHSLKIDDICDIYIGVDNCEIIQKYLKENCKESDEEYNYFTVKTKTELFVIKAEDIKQSFKWLQYAKRWIYKYQMQKNKEIEKKNEIQSKKIETNIQKIWNDYIFNKWTEYGRYLLNKKQNKLEYRKVLTQMNKKEKIKSDLIDDRLNFNYKKIIFFINEANNKLSNNKLNNNILDYNEFLFLYKIGIPYQCRHILWDCLIDNSCGITKDIYDFYAESLKKDEKIENILLENNIINNDSLKEYDELAQKIIIDINLIKDLFVNNLYIANKPPNELFSILFRINNIFFLMRRDIPYNKNIIVFSFIFYFVFKEEFACYKNLFNLICSTNIIKYYIRDDTYIEKNCEIFKSFLKKYIPKIYFHFNNLSINNGLYSIFWFKNLFTQTLTYPIIVRAIDLFLIYGEELLFEIGLTLIKIQEEDLLNYPINEIFKILKRLPNKYNEEIFFENLYLMNIHDEYNNIIVRNNLSDQLDFLCS